jgi:hypothetical protein
MMRWPDDLHRQPLPHGPLLDPVEGVALRQPVAVHQEALRPVDDPTGVELLLEPLHLGVQRLHLLVAPEGDLDGGQQLGALERLHEVGEGAGVARPLDEVALREGGEDQHRGEAFGGDLLGGGEAVHPRHLDVEDGDVGRVRPHELHGLVTTPGLPHHLVALLLEGLLEVEADDRLVLGDDDPRRHAARPWPAAGPLGPRSLRSLTVGPRPRADRAGRPGPARASGPSLTRSSR